MEDRRKHDRSRLDLQVEVYELHSGERLGRLADLSRDGFMVFCEKPLAADSVMQLRLVPARPLEGIESVALGADCLWSRAGSETNNGWAGFQIIDIATDQASALKILLRYLVQG